MSAANERSGGGLSSLLGYGRGTGGLPLGWEGRDRRWEFLLCRLGRDEDGEGRGGVEEEGRKKQEHELKKGRWQSDKRMRDKCHSPVDEGEPDPFVTLNN